MSPARSIEPSQLAARIKAARNVRGLTQQALARETALPQPQISRLEQGQVVHPSLRDVAVVARVLELDLDRLVNAAPADFFAYLGELDRPESTDWLDGWCESAELATELDRWLSGHATVLVEDESVAAALLSAPAMSSAVVIGLAALTEGQMAVSDSADRSELDAALLQELRRRGVVSARFDARLLTGEQRVVCVGSEEELGWVRSHWPALVERGLLFVHGTEAPALVEQLLLDVDGRFSRMTLWEREDEELVRRNGLVGKAEPKPEPHRAVVVDDPLSPPRGLIPFGEINVGSPHQRAIALPVESLSTHMYLCGTTGSGKSVLLERIAFGLAKDGRSMTVIDPHGYLVDGIARAVATHAPERLEDLLVIDWSDEERPIAFNPLDVRSRAELEPAVGILKEMLLKMLNLNLDSAPRAVNYFEQAAWALAECNLRAFADRPELRLTVLHLSDFFTDYEFRQLVMQFCTNPSIRATFDPEDGPFEKLGERQQLDHMMPVLRTIAALSTKDSFRRIFSQPVNQVDFTTWVREGRIVLMKLPAVASNASVATFIGAMLIPSLVASIANWGGQSLSHYLVVDEFQNYATESYKALLASTRKHGLYGISANQVPQDLPGDVLRGVQSNTQTKISMRLDPRAVKEIAGFIASGHEHPRPEDISALPNYWGWANHMMDNGTTSGPFMFRALDPLEAEDTPELRRHVERTRPPIDPSLAEYTARQRAVRERLEQLIRARIDETERELGPSGPDPDEAPPVGDPWA